MLWLRGAALRSHTWRLQMMTPCLSCIVLLFAAGSFPVPAVQLVAFCRRVRAVPDRRRGAEKLHISPGLLATRLASIRHCRTRRAIAVQQYRIPVHAV